jgi:hypothetical protein
MLRDVSGMTVSLFALQELQPVHVQDFDCSRCDPPDEALAFQLCERAFRRLGYRSKIIRKIEAVHRQLQKRSFFVEELWKTQEIKNEGGKTLTGVLLTECHDPMLGLAKIICHLRKKVQLELRVRQHHLLHSQPRNAIDSGWADRLCRVDISTVLGTPQKIAWYPERQNLPAAIFGASAYPDDTFINEVEKPGSFSLREDGTSAAPVDEHRCVVEEPLLFLA